MSFSAATCLTYTGTTTLGGILDLYSDVDGYTVPFQTNINLSAITGSECPYYISNVPNGTTIIKLHDLLTDCCATFPVLSNDLCSTCNLNFNIYSGSTVGRIIAGDITGTCQTNISDYRVYWYNTGDTTTPIFTSGKGTEYQPYSFTHPLTGSSAIFAPAGTYIPIIDKIKLSGLTFSQTGGTGMIPAELDCFSSTTVYVDYFRCDNGTTSDDPLYSHRVNFLSAGIGITPQSLYSDFLFTGSTNFFAWRFSGFDVEDRLRLSYYGTAYTTPIVLEDVVIGRNLSQTDFTTNKFPKSASTFANQYLKKVTCLTGLTRNPNDYIRMEVIPNTANTQTNWDFYFTCLDNIATTGCTFQNAPYKISATTITTITGNCSQNNIYFRVIGCTRFSDDFSKYFTNQNGAYSLNNTVYYDSQAYGFMQPSYQLYTQSPRAGLYLFLNYDQKCTTPNTNTITFKKYVSGGTLGIIDMEFSDVNDLNHYYNSYLRVATGSTSYGGICVNSSGVYSGTPYDPTNIKYYRYYTLGVPTNTGSTNCGDGTTKRFYNIHTSTEITTGTTGPNYSLRLTMPTMVNNLTYDLNCNYSGTVQGTVAHINSQSTGTSNNYTGTTLTGSKYDYPFTNNIGLCSGSTSLTALTSNGLIYVPRYVNETIPYTGTTPTLVPSLSAKTFNFTTNNFTLQGLSNNLDYYYRYQFWYTVKLTNPLDIRDFEIYTRGITGGTISSTENLIYSYTGSTSAYTIHDPTYFI